MFRVRVVDGKNKGMYFKEFDEDGMGPVWCSHESDAKISDVSNTMSLIAASIDVFTTVVAAERLPDTTEEDCQKLAETIANDFWVNPSDNLINLIKRTIRKNPEDPIYEFDRSQKGCQRSGFMSVLEWVGVASHANKEKEPDTK